jgi:hypothetical protein
VLGCRVQQFTWELSKTRLQVFDNPMQFNQLEVFIRYAVSSSISSTCSVGGRGTCVRSAHCALLGPNRYNNLQGLITARGAQWKWSSGT